METKVAVLDLDSTLHDEICSVAKELGIEVVLDVKDCVLLITGKLVEASVPIALITNEYSDAKSFKSLRDEKKVAYLIHPPFNDRLLRSWLASIATSKEDLTQMQQEYIQEINDKLSDLESKIASFEQSGSENFLKPLIDTIDTLAGSSGSYGFWEASLACKEVSRHIQMRLKTAPVDVERAFILEQLGQFMRDLKLAFQLPPTQEKGQSPTENHKDLSHIAASYAASVPQKMQALRSDLDKVIARSESEALDAFINGIHKLAGSAGSYGFACAGDVCKSFENELRAFVTNWDKQSIPPEQLQVWQQTLNQIEDAFKTVIGAHLDSADERLDLFVCYYDTDLLQLVEKEAKRVGLKTAGCTNPIELVDKVKDPNFNPRLLVMPETFVDKRFSGYTIVSDYRSLRDNPGMIGLIVIEKNIDNHLKSLSHNIDFFLERPISVQEIVELVQSAKLSHLTRPFKVLALDDDADILRFIDHSLKEIGVSVCALGTPENLFEVIDNEKPDLLLLDLKLPLYHGLDILSSIRSDSRYRHLPVHILTVCDDPETMGKAYQAHVDGFIVKPISKATLQTIVRYYARKESLSNALARLDENRDVLSHSGFLYHMRGKLEEPGAYECKHIYGLLSVEPYRTLVRENQRDLAEELLGFVIHKLQMAMPGVLLGRFDDDVIELFFFRSSSDEVRDRLREFVDDLSRHQPLDKKKEVFVTTVVGVACYPQDGNSVERLIDSGHKSLQKAKAAGNQAIIFSNEGESAQTATRKQVMVVDDDQDICQLLQVAFEQNHLDIILCRTYSEAIEFYKKCPVGDFPDLMILDRILPDGDGLELYRTLKKSYPTLPPVLFLSSLSSEEETLKSLSEGAVDYIAKPFSLPVLVQKSLRLLQK